MKTEKKDMNRIKELRIEKGMTVEELAVVAGVSQSMLSNYENGHGTPRNLSVWNRLAECFGVSVPYLMGFVSDLEPVFQELSSLAAAEDSAPGSLGKPFLVTFHTKEEFLLCFLASQIDATGRKKLIKEAKRLFYERKQVRCVMDKKWKKEFALRIGRNIHDARVSRGFRQKDLADSLGIIDSTLSKIERGLYIPPLPLFYGICVILDAGPEELLFSGSGGSREEDGKEGGEGF